jgi:hypothetical protein
LPAGCCSMMVAEEEEDEEESEKTLGLDQGGGKAGT